MQVSLSQEPKIVIVMPVYNEADTIRTTLTEAYEKIAGGRDGVSFIICEDGSTDGTKDALLALASEMPCLRVSLSPTRKGYPGAARDVILAPDGGAEYLLFMDSDGQYDPADFQALWNSLESSSSDIIVGSRVKRAEPLLRIFLSKGLRIIERALFQVGFQDVTSAFRLMRREVAQDVARMVRYSRYNFWLEFTALASLHGYKTSEVPVAYRARHGKSRVYDGSRIFKATILELMTVIRIWLNFYLRRRTRDQQKWSTHRTL